jgi:hypothetical protein
MRIEGLVIAQLETLPPVAEPVVTDHLIAVLDDAERHAGPGAWVTTLHLEDALKACAHPKIEELVARLEEESMWEASTEARREGTESERPPEAVEPSSEWLAHLESWTDAARLLELHLLEVGVRPPADLDRQPTTLALREASPALRAALVEIYLCRRSGREDFSARYGKYADRALRTLVRQLIADPTIAYPTGYAIRLFEQRRLLPAETLDVITRLVARDGMTVALATRLHDVIAEAITLVEETEWDAGEWYEREENVDELEALSDEQYAEIFSEREQAAQMLRLLVGRWVKGGEHGPDLDPQLEALDASARQLLSERGSAP